jgi:membrane protein implicated in regulation of membrane protease activity
MALPEGLKFPQAGWWLLHAVTVWFVWAWAYRRGRTDERRDQRTRELEQGKR